MGVEGLCMGPLSWVGTLPSLMHSCASAVHMGQGTGALGEERGHGARPPKGADHPVAQRLLQALPRRHGVLLHLRPL